MKTIKLRNYGITPGKDITREINFIFDNHKEDTIFEFEKGDYYFSPHDELKQPYNLSNTDTSDYKTLGLWFKNMRRCIISGGGARLWFAGQMQPITMDDCHDFQIRDFTIDWKKPLVAEGVVVDYGEDWVKLSVDSDAFPHRYENGWLEFDTGAGEWYTLNRGSCIQFDADTLCIRRNSGDKFKPLSIEDEGNNVYKITSVETVDTAKGNIFVLRHNARLHAGIFMEASRDISVENITIHSCGGLGCLSQFCHNVRFERINFVPNTQLNRRVVNGRDDGMHITSNSGTVMITQCNFLGLMDDPVNVHGCSVVVEEMLDNKTLRCSYRHDQAKGFAYWAKAGDQVAFVDRKTMVSLKKMKVHSYKVETAKHFELRFEKKIPADIRDMVKREERLALENITNTAEVICTKNRFGSCRARGMLVSTPRCVLIEDNYFETSGSAILIAGDCNYWFESGACCDVTIRNNVFTNQCNSSHYEFCEGVISISPLVPEPDKKLPFHKNIRICGNVFDVVSSRSVYALSCKNLFIEDNIIFTSAADYDQDIGGSVKLTKCNGVKIRNNNTIGNRIGSFVVNEDSANVVCDKELNIKH